MTLYCVGDRPVSRTLESAIDYAIANKLTHVYSERIGDRYQTLVFVLLH